jgi:hypothetical protein
MSKTTTKFFCFVLMPFSEDFDDIYNYGIKESCKAAGTYCERVDEQIYQNTILERIYTQIAKADLIIADMTGRNPNVFYEVGFAHALNKPTILLTQNTDDIPFDLKNYPHIIYSKKISVIREDLTKRLLWFKQNKNKNAQIQTWKQRDALGDLLKYPPAPNVPIEWIGTDLMDLYTDNFYDEDKAFKLLSKAITRKKTLDKEGTCIKYYDFPQINYNGSNTFWNNVFIEACLHGPRMVAAILIETIEIIYFTQDQKDTITNLLIKIINLKQK